MKYIGIDYGTKRVGIALSDDNGKIAFPKCVLANDNNIIENLKALILENGVEKIVLGESKNYKMEDNEIMTEISDLKKVLETELEIDVDFQAEFLSSIEAEKMRGNLGQKSERDGKGTSGAGKEGMLDASAAAIILQSYLDKKK